MRSLQEIIRINNPEGDSKEYLKGKEKGKTKKLTSRQVEEALKKVYEGR